MTQNPYAQIGRSGGPGGFDTDDVILPAERRTSVLAVFSLILSLLCFIPGAGALAIICGGAAIVFISSSRGRLGGLGMAITGVLIGLFFSVLWVLLVVGAAEFNKQGVKFFEPTGKVLIAIEADDWSTARNGLSPALNAAVTDARLAEFKAEYGAKVGTYQSMPRSLWEMGKAYMTIGQQMQGFQPKPGAPVIPMPATFSMGPALVIGELQTGRSGGTPGAGMPPLDNLGIMAGDGTEIWLLPKAGAIPPAVTPPSLPAPEAPKAPDAPAGGGG